MLISDLLDGAASRADTFEALSAMSSGAVIVDGDMRILHANAAGRRSLYGKTNTHRRADLVRLATELGIRP